MSQMPHCLSVLAYVMRSGQQESEVTGIAGESSDLEGLRFDATAIADPQRGDRRGIYCESC